jgi:AcrR family transcriptional regulator
MPCHHHTVMTRGVVNYASEVGRWRPDARERLQQAALELFAEQGFAATTVPEITARAGLTTRTFFRHFADKREVIFSEDAEMPAMVAKLMASAPPGAFAEPMTLFLDGLRHVAEDRFEPRKAALLARRDLVGSDESLRERDLHKRAALAEAIRTGFIEHGIAAPRAALLAETCVTVMFVGIAEWLDTDDGRKLYDIIVEALAALRSEL